MKLRTVIVSVVAVLALAFPLGSSAGAYHCYSPEVGDCSAVQHALENVGEQLGGKNCYLIHKVTGGNPNNC